MLFTKNNHIVIKGKKEFSFNNQTLFAYNNFIYTINSHTAFEKSTGSSIDNPSINNACV